MEERKNLKTDTNEIMEQELAIANDIYMLAFVAQINPRQIEKGEDKSYLQKLHLMDDERNYLFMSALSITGIQLTTAVMIVLLF